MIYKEKRLKEFEEFMEVVLDESKWIDDKPVYKGTQYVTLYNAVKDFLAETIDGAFDEGRRYENKEWREFIKNNH